VTVKNVSDSALDILLASLDKESEPSETSFGYDAIRIAVDEERTFNYLDLDHTYVIAVDAGTDDPNDGGTIEVVGTPAG